PYLLGSLRKGLELLDCFARRKSWSLAELAAELGQPKPTVFRLLHTIETFGYLHKDPETGRYSLGMRLHTLGSAAVRHAQLRWQALPPLQDLAQETGETVHVGILYDGESICVQAVDGTRLVRMHAFVGKRTPAHASALGKALLAYLPDAEVEAFAASGLAAHTPHTLIDPAALRAALHQVRAQGYALDDEEMELGLRCLGAPITDHTGRPCAAVAVSVPAMRMDGARIAALVPLLKATAARISRMLGAPTMHDAA
ncbi:MAG: IclR family transcriptional regulator, partial [Rhodospirillales bacterium]|nr:IclR family transcriptional regulator [Rhodospirillales bacterium]